MPTDAHTRTQLMNSNTVNEHWSATTAEAIALSLMESGTILHFHRLCTKYSARAHTHTHAGARTTWSLIHFTVNSPKNMFLCGESWVRRIFSSKYVFVVKRDTKFLEVFFRFAGVERLCKAGGNSSDAIQMCVKARVLHTVMQHGQQTNEHFKFK